MVTIVGGFETCCKAKRCALAARLTASTHKKIDDRADYVNCLRDRSVKCRILCGRRHGGKLRLGGSAFRIRRRLRQSAELPSDDLDAQRCRAEDLRLRREAHDDQRTSHELVDERRRRTY